MRGIEAQTEETGAQIGDICAVQAMLLRGRLANTEYSLAPSCLSLVWWTTRIGWVDEKVFGQ
jgi:hypothetical protein